MAFERLKKNMYLKLEKSLRSDQQKEMFDRALNLYHDKKYAEAKSLFNHLIEDDIEANYYYAKCCQLDTTPKFNYRHFYTIMEYCANNEYAPAFYEAGKILENELFLDKAFDLPIDWYKKGAKRNDANCLYELGIHYLQGDKVKQNIDKGIQWLEKSANQNHSNANYLLSNYYRNGKYVTKDDVVANQYLEKAASLGHVEAQAHYGYALEFGLGIEKDIEKAIEWYQCAAQQNQVNALYRLGKIYKYGLDVAQDYKQGSEYLLKAAKLNHHKAIIEYAKICTEGTYYQKSDINAMSWYLKVINDNPTKEEKQIIYYDLIKIFLDMDSEEFNIYLARKYYQLALEVEQYKVKEFDQLLNYFDTESNKYFEQAKKYEQEDNLQMSLKYYDGAGHAGYSNGYVHAGLIYEKQLDYPKAFEYYKKSLTDSNAWANELLGNLYYEGKGIEKDIDKAIEHYQFACDNGQTNPLSRLIRELTLRNDLDNAHRYTIQLANSSCGIETHQACYDLGLYYENNDEQLSKVYFMKAIENGHEEAILRKYKIYATNYNQKKEWLERISDSHKALYELYLLTKNNENASIYAYDYLVEASKKGNPNALYEMGSLAYENKNYEQAEFYFLKSNNVKSCIQLGVMNKEGIYYPKDYQKAINWYMKGIITPDCGVSEAEFVLNEILDDSFESTKVFYQRGIEIFINQGHYNHKFVEALLKYKNEDAKQLACYYNRVLADSLNVEACYQYGLASYNGTYFTMYHNDAYKYLKMAATRGHVEAMYQLGYVMFFGRSEVDQDEYNRKMDDYISYLDDTYNKYDNTAKEELLKYKDEKFVEGKIDDIILKNLPFGTVGDVRYDVNQLIDDVYKLKWKSKEYDEQYYENQKLSSYLLALKSSELKYKNFDIYEAFDWLEKAAECNHSGAMVLIGKYNINAEGYEERKYARELLEKASKLGNEEAKEILRNNPK